MKAQILGARVEGVVRDPSQAVVAGAAVTAANQDTGLSRASTTDAQGRYVFNDLPPGRKSNPVSGTTAGCTGMPAGQFTGTRTPSRQMQLALKFIF